MLVCAVYSEDNSWYRARVVDAPSPDCITVHFVDYGNQDKIAWRDTAKLVDRFLQTPELVRMAV